MKKIFLIILTLIVLITTSCSNSKFEVNDKIMAPESTIPPLQGKWVIEKAIEGPYIKGSNKDEIDFVGKEALFHKDAVVIGEDYVLEPQFKLKNVRLSDYLLYKYKTDLYDLELNMEEAQILTIFSNGQYFHEFIKYSEDEMITVVDGKFYFLKKNVEKISKEEVDRYINIEKDIVRISNVEDVDTLRSGVLLGIKSYDYDDENQKEDWKYRTLWIRFNNYQMASVYEIENLLVPRKKGFWKVDIKKEKNRDKIQAKQISNFKEELEEFMMMARFMETAEEPNISKEILYIGNDYVSTETVDQSNGRRSLEVYPIDYLEEERAITISDIAGDEGLKSFIEGSRSILNRDANISLNENNFGLSRRNGYWIMKGRINYQSNEEELFMDFNIKTIPPKELVNYDELLVPWSKIKSRVPEAIDAFTSPNDDIIIISTRNELLIYSLKDKEISQKELGKIKISNTDSIVMSEWGLGRYATLWEEEVLKDKSVIKLEY